MNQDHDQSADAAGLRRRAEERLSKKRKIQRSEAGNQSTADDTARLVHELQVHEIELEMQNEELRKARAQGETLLTQYIDLYDFAPVGYLTLDPEGAIRQVNLAGARLLGVERSRLMNRRFGLFAAESDRRTFSDFLQKVFAGQAEAGCEVTLRRENSQPVVVRINGLRSVDGQECRAVVVDITERKRAEKALCESETELRVILESTTDGILAVDSSGEKVIKANRRFGDLWQIPQSLIDAGDNRANSDRFKRWRVSGSWPPVWRTTSTTSWR
jgi:PAS domain S-box-containing protein